jgi:hypothetical protein
MLSLDQLVRWFCWRAGQPDNLETLLATWSAAFFRFPAAHKKSRTATVKIECGSGGRWPGWVGWLDPGSSQFLLCFTLPQSCGEVGTGELPADAGGGQLLNVPVH